jgi:hypothetical protein
MMFFLLVLVHNILPFVSLLQDEPAANFNELGKLLLGGFVAAIAVALAFTFVRLRLRDKKPQASNFISIGAVDDK